MGILALMTYIGNLCMKYEIKRGTVHIGCDGKGALDAIINKYEIVKSSRKHFDIISSIHRLIDFLPINWTFRHIKAHQDDIKSYDELTRWEQLNVEADTLAKEHMKEMISEDNWMNERPTLLPMETCIITWTDSQGRSHRISSNLTKVLNDKLGCTQLREYWKKKGKFTPYTERMIDWDSHHKSHNNLPTGRNRWLSKWLTGFCGIGVILQLYKHQDHTRCPRCQQREGSVAHVIQCPALSATNLWLKSIEDLRKWMKENEGNSTLCDMICNNLKAWQKQALYPPGQTPDTILAQALKEQDRIGWQSFLEGYWSTQWRVKQQEHLETINSRKSATLWISRAQRKIWEIAWQMWMHRNEILHNNGTTIHSHEMTALNGEIIKEMMTGQDSLSNRFANLFKSNIQKRLAESFHLKRLWLTSVWTARDNQNTRASESRNTDASMFYNRWKKKRKRELDEGN